MATTAIYLVAALAAVIIGVSCLLGAQQQIQRRTQRSILALTPPAATVTMALIAGSPGAILPMFIFGGIVGISIAVGWSRGWFPI